MISQHSTIPPTWAEQAIADTQNVASIATATRFLTILVFVLLGLNILVLLGVAAILGILMHALIMPLPPVGGP